MASLRRAPASECTCPPRPLIPGCDSPSFHLPPAPSAPKPSPPECRRREIHTRPKAPALPVPPTPAIQDRRPRPPCSALPPSPAPLPVGPAEYVLWSAASDRRSPPPPE